MARNKQKNKRKLAGIVVLITIILSVSVSLAYNIVSYYEDTRKDDGYSGFAQERDAGDFTVDGCGVGTMLDTVTGLCWQKDLSSYLAYDGTTLTWSEAGTYCDGLDGDWRLPTRAELMTLIDEIGGSGSTCTSLEGFGFTNCLNNSYWSKNEYQPNTGAAWDVNFNDGNDGADGKTLSGYAVCVRRH